MLQPRTPFTTDSDTDSLNGFIEGDNHVGPQDDIDADFVNVVTRDFSMENEKDLKQEKTRLH